jgi:hypothetical protein
MEELSSSLTTAAVMPSSPRIVLRSGRGDVSGDDEDDAADDDEGSIASRLSSAVAVSVLEAATPSSTP